MAKIRILEQEVERHLKRVSILEQQLREVEARYRERTEQAMQERKVERERDHSRHTASMKQLEHSLNSRERMYKERIAGLEEQVHIVRDQLARESKNRRTYISSSHTLSNDVKELRRELMDSLATVQNSSRTALEGGVLEKETSRLQHTLARQGREVDSKSSRAREEVMKNQGNAWHTGRTTASQSYQ